MLISTYDLYLLTIQTNCCPLDIIRELIESENNLENEDVKQTVNGPSLREARE